MKDKKQMINDPMADVLVHLREGQEEPKAACGNRSSVLAGSFRPVPEGFVWCPSCLLLIREKAKAERVTVQAPAIPVLRHQNGQVMVHSSKDKTTTQLTRPNFQPLEEVSETKPAPRLATYEDLFREEAKKLGITEEVVSKELQKPTLRDIKVIPLPTKEQIKSSVGFHIRGRSIKKANL